MGFKDTMVILYFRCTKKINKYNLLKNETLKMTKISRFYTIFAQILDKL